MTYIIYGVINRSN